MTSALRTKCGPVYWHVDVKKDSPLAASVNIIMKLDGVLSILSVSMILTLNGVKCYETVTGSRGGWAAGRVRVRLYVE